MRRATTRRRADPSILPDGFHYREDFISEGEERQLIAFIQAQTFNEVRMHGVTAKRHVLHWGWDYGYESWKIAPAAPIPQDFLELQRRAAQWMAIEPSALQELLVTEYPPGAAIGWHRDAPMFGDVAGVSLLSACTFKLRPTPQHEPVVGVELAPRSAYWLSGTVRQKWQHSLVPVRQLRYSVTFRTLRHLQSE
jgi:DNA oxidative demethylase